MGEFKMASCSYMQCNARHSISLSRSLGRGFLAADDVSIQSTPCNEGRQEQINSKDQDGDSPAQGRLVSRSRLGSQTLARRAEAERVNLYLFLRPYTARLSMLECRSIGYLSAYLAVRVRASGTGYGDHQSPTPGFGDENERRGSRT